MVLRNSYFAHQKYALIAMLGNFNKNVRSVGVAIMLARRKQVAEESYGAPFGKKLFVL